MNAPSKFFRFTQVEFPWALGPPDGRYLIRRVVQLGPVLLGISLVTFLIVRLAPGDPAAMLLDATLVSPQELARFRGELGLDAPWPMQFVTLLKQLVTASSTRSERASPCSRCSPIDCRSPQCSWAVPSC